MVTVSERKPAPPLTHQVFFAAAQAAIDHGARPSTLLWVQARRLSRQGPYILCGKILGISASSGADWFKVETAIDTFWALGRDLRLCSGDGRCTCEAKDTA